MIKIFLKGRSATYNAIGIYDEDTNTVTVLKGSSVNPKLEIFKGTNSIERNREGVIKNGVVIADTTFNSPSTAANFVTGRSTNGMIAWKNENGESLKKIKTKCQSNI